MMTTGRYRLLQSDYDAIREHGTKIGDRDALQANRIGLPCNSWPGLDYADRQAQDELYRIGVDVSAITDVARLQLTEEWIKGYRDAYLDTYEEG